LLLLASGGRGLCGLLLLGALSLEPLRLPSWSGLRDGQSFWQCPSGRGRILRA
jgi:hypothetical protein